METRRTEGVSRLEDVSDRNSIHLRVTLTTLSTPIHIAQKHRTPASFAF